MEVILLKEVYGLGHAGEVKEVKSGYARNYLIPAGLAFTVTRHNLRMLEAQKKKLIKLELKNNQEKIKLAKKINGQEFEIKVKADDKGTLFAGLDAKVIADELQKQGFFVETKEVILNKAIKKVGEYEVELRLEEKKAKIKIIISKQ